MAIKDFKTLHIGDEFIESEYGSMVLLKVVTEPKLERTDYMVFKAKIVKSSNSRRIGEVVDYGFSYPSGAYNPTIWDPEIYGDFWQKLDTTNTPTGAGKD